MSRTCHFVFTLFVVATLAGCSGGGILSPEVDRTTASARSAKYRTVVRGDTLFSIAWDIRVDFRTLARWNNIRSPYVIKPGQRLRITGSRRRTAAPKRRGSRRSGAPSVRYYRVKKGDTVYSIARKTGKQPRQIVHWNRLRKPYKIRVGQRLRISRMVTRTARRSKGKPRKRASKQRRASTAKKPISVGRWVWPAKGKILRRYTPAGASKGVDIGGRSGDPVRAAAGGQVVYRGSGLRGYGKLIIIKHNSDFLSAYAHSSSILVKEGSRVKRGQRIATMGSTGTDRVKLHFEIRLRGNPVNPLRYLPTKF